MLLNITSFARERNVEPQAVSRYLSRHPELSSMLIEDGRERMIDTESTLYSTLENKYPIPKPVQIINGIPENEHMAVLDELNHKNEQIQALQNKLFEMGQQMADMRVLQIESEQTKLRLEEKTKERDEYRDMALELRAQKIEIQGKADRLQERLDKKEEMLQKKNKKISDQRQEYNELVDEFNELQGRSLWDRIFNK